MIARRRWPRPAGKSPSNSLTPAPSGPRWAITWVIAASSNSTALPIVPQMPHMTPPPYGPSRERFCRVEWHFRASLERTQRCKGECSRRQVMHDRWRCRLAVKNGCERPHLVGMPLVLAPGTLTPRTTGSPEAQAAEVVDPTRALLTMCLDE